MSHITYEVEVYDDGDTFWYLNDQLHRPNGPAAEYANGTQLWYFNGLKHRTDGPAAEYGNGERYWFLEGQEYTEAEWKAKLNPDDCEGKTVTIDGTTYTLNRT